jgi:hypothetical protein
MSKDKENNIYRLKNWAAIHIKELDNHNFDKYLELYSKTESNKYTGKNYPFFVFSTGHTGSLWTTFLFQILNPDVMVCLHDHETVHNWTKFKFSTFDEKKWNYWLHCLDEIKHDEPRAVLEKLSPELLQHMVTELSRYPVVGYCLTGVIDLYYEIMKSAANLYKTSKTICLARNGIQVVNSLFHIFLNTLPDYYKYSSSDGDIKIQNLKNEFFVILFRDPLLKNYSPIFEEVKKSYLGYDLFITCCIMWNGIYDKLIVDYSKKGSEYFFITRLEDIITGKKHIMELYCFLLGEIDNTEFFDYAVEFTQSMDINRKIANKQPDSIWQKQWNVIQREIFSIICRKMMNYFKYEIPDNN